MNERETLREGGGGSDFGEWRDGGHAKVLGGGRARGLCGSRALVLPTRRELESSPKGGERSLLRRSVDQE